MNKTNPEDHLKLDETVKITITRVPKPPKKEGQSRKKNKD